MENKKYRVRILMQSGTTQQWLEEEFEASLFTPSDYGYYYFSVNGKPRYYPINQTIVEEI
jgi:hypothetical protein